MKRSLYHIILFVMLVASNFAYTQVAVNFNASLYGRSMNGLSFAQIINASSQAVFAKIKITARELKHGTVVTVNVPYRQYNVGASNINSLEFAKSNFVFSQNTLGIQLNKTGRFADGEYDFCFEVTVGDPKTLAVYDVSEFCFQSLVEPIAPLMLVDPAPGDRSCNTRPGFTWQPPVPMQAGAQFRIIVCEKNDKQTDIEAITYNIPVINIGGIFINTLPFPAKTPELKKDKKYVWQVTVYQEKTILTKSEIWEFEVKCEEEKKEPGTDSYRELKEVEDGNYFIADKILRISFDNPYNPGTLNYSIVSLSKPNERIKRLPELKLGAGLNKHEIDLSEHSSFKKDEEYMIIVKLENNRELKLRFIYTE